MLTTLRIRRVRGVAAAVALGAALATGLMLAGPAMPARAAADSVAVDGVTYQAGAGATATATACKPSAGCGPQLVIPASVTIGGSPYAVTAIGDSAFTNSSLTSVTLPDSVVSIGASAFSLNALRTATIPDSVASIGDSAFAFNALISVALPSSTTAIAHAAFADNQLTSVTIPDSVTAIGAAAFQHNDLASVTIGSSVASIGDDAFAVNQLAAVTVPGSVASIGESAFAGNSLANVVFQGAAPTAFTPAGSRGSLGRPGPLVHYRTAYASDTGFTTPQWQGYDAVPSPTVAFDTGGHGAPVASANPDWNTPVAQPAAPVATGYTFAGWFTAAAGGSPWDFTTPVTEDLTLYAHWTINQYTVAFDAAGGATVPPQTVDYGTPATPPANPTWAGHTFAGWYQGGTAWDFSTPVTADLALTAHWSTIPVIPVPPAGGSAPVTAITTASTLPATGSNLGAWPALALLALVLGAAATVWAGRRRHG